jgi:hypothetical protein
VGERSPVDTDDSHTPWAASILHQFAFSFSNFVSSLLNSIAFIVSRLGGKARQKMRAEKWR